jgi:hypothetical protein
MSNPYVEAGSRFSTDAMLRQCRYSKALMEEETEELHEVGREGWTPDHVADFDKLFLDLQKQAADGKLVSDDISLSADGLDSLVEAAKQWKKDLDDYANNAFELQPQKLDDFAARKSIGSSRPRMVAWLGTALAAVEEHFAALKIGGAPDDFALQGKAHLENLAKGMADQEVDIASIPVGVAALRETKGRLHFLLKRLNRTGRRLHRNDAARAARYNLDLLYRR